MKKKKLQQQIYQKNTIKKNTKKKHQTNKKKKQSAKKLQILDEVKEDKPNKVSKISVNKFRRPRRNTKKSDYSKKHSVGAGFDLFTNYRVKDKERKNKAIAEKQQIEKQLRERKKSLIKPGEKYDKSRRKKK
eukprot:570257_1